MLKKYRILFMAILGALFLLSVFASLTVGPVSVPLRSTLSILQAQVFGGAGDATPPEWQDIILKIRLPRMLLGMLVGAALAIAGAVFQSLLKNPLADPYTLGISSGAALGATLSILFGATLSAGFLKDMLTGPFAIPVWAFLGALATLFLVYWLARVSGRLPVVTLLLAGVMLSAFFSSVILLLVSVSSRQLHEVFFWLMGNLATVDFALLKAAWGYALVCFVLIYMFARDLNALSFGEEQARHLGVSVDRVKTLLFVIVSLMVGASVSLSGLIGFVGLVVPHALRILLGADHRLLIPACAVGGSFFLMTADTIGRTVPALLGSPTEIPVGVVTALIGAPFFLYLLRKSRKIN